MWQSPVAPLSLAKRADGNRGNQSGATDLAAFLRVSLSLMAAELDASAGLVVVPGTGKSSVLAFTLGRGQVEMKDAGTAIVKSAVRALRTAGWAEEIRLEHTVALNTVDRDSRRTWELQAHFRSKGATAMVTVPIMVSGQIAGVFAFGVHRSSRLCSESREILLTLAKQASVGLRMSGVAEGSRPVALAQQEEQAARIRAECIQRWRHRVDTALGLLASSSGVEAAVGEVLGEAVQQFGASGGAIWRVDATGMCRLLLSFEEGEARGAGTSEHPGFRPTARPPHIKWHLKRGEVRIDDRNAIWTNPEYAPFRNFFARRRVRCIAVAPMYLADTFHGAVTLRFAEEPHLTVDDVELLEAFANQAVFASELTRLSRAAQAAAVSEERNRLARDMHDTIAQGLVAIIRHLECVSTGAAEANAMQHIKVAIETARDSLANTRRSIRGLHPTLCGSRRLDAAVEDLVGRLRTLSIADIQLTVQGRSASPPVEVEGELLLILQEALTNTVKHAAATTVTVDLWMLNGSIQIRVRDNGVGFDPFCAVDGVGLSSMYERAQKIGATIKLSSVVGRGTELLMSWSGSRPNRCWTAEV